MHHFELILLGLLIAVAALSALARVLGTPYPVLLVIGGAVFSFVPGLPHVELDPSLVLLIFLPPLLFHAAYFSSGAELRRDARAITLNAVGIVLITTSAVAVIAHAAIGDLSWAAAFTLGAIVAPTDPPAATAIMHRVGVPPRVVNVIEGESLINDGTALVVYRSAVAAAVGGSFDLLDASWDFIINIAGGIAIGLVVGRLMVPVLRSARVDATLLVTLSLLNGYLGYIPAEELGVSGVLAAVTVGLVLARYSDQITTAEARISGYGFWDILVFLLNAVLFVLVGFQLHQIFVDQERSVGELLGLGAAVSVTAIVVRIACLNSIPYVVRAIDRRPSQTARRISWQHRMVVGWAGLRGAVSLAAALALPVDFPERDLVVFLALCVIFATLVGQGLTLPWIIRRLGVHDDGSRVAEELNARRTAAEAALVRLRELHDAEWTRDRSVERLIEFYEFRLQRLAQRAGETTVDDHEARSLGYQRMLFEVLEVERATLLERRAQGLLSDEVMHRIERELDLQAERLDPEARAALGPGAMPARQSEPTTS